MAADRSTGDGADAPIADARTANARTDKAGDAFRTIGEVAQMLGLPQHILRYWETRFPQLKPLQRAGNRRYYRTSDVALAQRIDRLLNHEGYTMRGVQKLLAEDDRGTAPSPATDDPVATLRALRDGLKLALVEDARLSL